MKPFFFDLSFEELEKKMTESGEPGYRGKQIWQLVYKNLCLTPESLINIPKELRSRLSAEFEFTPLFEVKNILSSDGQTNKFLFQLQEGKKIEAVLIRYLERNTIFISTHFG